MAQPGIRLNMHPMRRMQALHRIWQANRMQQMQKAQAGCRMQSLTQMPQTAGQSRSSRSMLWQEAFQKAL